MFAEMNIVYAIAGLFILTSVGYLYTARKNKKLNEHRLNLLHVLNHSAALLFYSDIDTFYNRFSQSLKVVVEPVEVDRVSIWRNVADDEGFDLRQIYCWDKEHEINLNPESKLYKLVLSDIAPDLEKLLSNGESYNGPLNLLVKSGGLNNLGIKSVFMTPIIKDNRFWGAVNYENHKREMQYDDLSVEMLRSAAFLLANSIIQNEMIETLNKTSKAAEAANDSKTEFLASMSHEIRTPMNSIMGFAELAIESDISPQVSNHLRKIIDNTEWLLSIVNDILDVSRIEADELELEISSFCPDELISRCKSFIMPDIKTKGLELIINADSLMDKMLTGDPVRLYQALSNLLSNALKFTHEGIISLSMLVKEADDNYVTIFFEVKDSGIGIAKDLQEIIFNPFIQADSSITRRYGGTGLGLAITKKIIELMGGTLAVESAPGLGSTFSFELTFETIKSNSETFVDSSKAITNQQNKVEQPVEVDGTVDDDKLLQKLRIKFLHNNLTKYAEIIEAITGGDTVLAHRLVHTLKGNAGFIGETELQKAAAVVESRLEDEKVPVAVEVLNNLESELTSVLEKLRPLLTKDSSTEFEYTNIEDGEIDKIKQNTILVVDDEETNIMVLSHILDPYYTVYASKEGIDAIAAAEDLLPDIILLDIVMPDMDGYEVLEKLKESEKTKDIPVIFLTSKTDPESEVKGLGAGAIDYIFKPFRRELLLKRVDLHLQLKTHTDDLEKEVVEKTQTVYEMQDAILETVAEMVECRDDITGGHIERTQNYLRLLVKRSIQNDVYSNELKEWNIDQFVMSSQLHDVGKINIKDSILMKPGKLTDEEFESMKNHTTFGKGIIERIESKTKENKFLEHAKLMATYHHEKWDGSGYPYGTKGKDIPLQGRLMAIVDVYDALTNDRPYKRAFSHAEALDIIKKGRGSHFDPMLCDVFIKYEKEVAGVKYFITHTYKA